MKLRITTIQDSPCSAIPMQVLSNIQRSGLVNTSPKLLSHSSYNHGLVSTPQFSFSNQETALRFGVDCFV